MFDITSSFKNFFISEEPTSESSISPQVTVTNPPKDCLVLASSDFSLSQAPPLFQDTKAISSCSRCYYFFEQESQNALPSYMMQEALFQETPFALNDQVLAQLGPNVQGKGSCKQSLTGLVYLDVSSDYIIELDPYFSALGGVHPNLQAHIALVSPEEAQRSGICLSEELNRNFSFTITGCEEITMTQWKGVEKVWILKVYSEECEQFRKELGLCPRILGKAFHILVSLKPTLEKPKPQEFFRVAPTVMSV